jgi:hypothetical protein
MKKLFYVLAFFAASQMHAQNENVTITAKTGIPIANSLAEKYVIGFEVKKRIVKRIHSGIGYKYSNIHSYDRKINSFYILSSYDLNIHDFGIIPGLQAGYAWLKYNLNIYDTKEQKTKGFFLSPNLTCKYKLNERIGVGINASYNIIFSTFKNNMDFPIPAYYFPYNKEIIEHTELGILLALSIGKIDN